MLPGNVVNIVPVGINAVARSASARSQLGKPGGRYDDDRQAQVYSGTARVEPDTRGIEMAVLREESFGETVPADAGFIDSRGGENGNERNTNQLYARGSKRVVARQSTPTNERKWKALLTIAQEIAPGQHVVLIEVVIDLDDAAVDVVGKWRCKHSVRRDL